MSRSSDETDKPSEPAHAFLHLEDDHDKATLDFVAELNAVSETQLCDEQFKVDRDFVQELLEADDRLIIGSRRGNWLYDFHRSPENPRGIWQRIPATETPRPDAPWEIVFDLDAFCASEDRIWVWGGAITAPFDPERVMLMLSDGGSDPIRFLEFDCRQKKPVEGGFDIAPAKSNLSWLDADTVILCTSAGKGDATRSGWPGAARLVRRGEDPLQAPVIFRVEPDDLLVSTQAITAWTDEPWVFFRQAHEILKSTVFLKRGEADLVRIDVPDDAGVTCNHTHSAWHTRSDDNHAAGTLYLALLNETGQGTASPRAIFVPEGRRVLDTFFLMKDWLVWMAQDNLSPELYVLDLRDEAAAPVQIALPDGFDVAHVFPLHAEPQAGDDTLQVLVQGLLRPQTLYRLNLPHRDFELKRIASAPERFQSAGVSAQLLEATSDDGTKIPYHIALPADDDGSKGDIPVLLAGYGGFDVSVTPDYRPVTGKLWLERGGAFVLAHIRGGGEFGPDWHRAAIRENRSRAFEDFAAIASDLVERGITRPERIACQGGSNGGLLTGVMLTRYPERFGAIWSSVPVLDMLRFHEFPAGRAWIDEYGDPDDADDRAFLAAYSPLHNVRADATYPAIYLESAANDDRVHPSHARRMAAILKETGHTFLFHEFGSGGHGGAGATFEQARKIAMGYAFLRQTVGRD